MIFLSASALFWLLRAGMAVVDGGIGGIGQFRGPNHDLATGDSMVKNVRSELVEDNSTFSKIELLFGKVIEIFAIYFKRAQ